MEYFNQISNVLCIVCEKLLQFAPTIVALYAVYKNNRSASRRDRANRESSSKLKILWDICEFTDELYVKISKFGAEVLTQTSKNSLKKDLEENERFWDSEEEIFDIQRKVKISSEIYETVGDVNLEWRKIYDSCDLVIEISQKVFEDIFGEEGTNQKLKESLEDKLNQFDREYRKYTETIRKEIKRIIES